MIKYFAYFSYIVSRGRKLVRAFDRNHCLPVIHKNGDHGRKEERYTMCVLGLLGTMESFP